MRTPLGTREVSRLSGEFYTVLYRAVHMALSANGVSAFQGEHYTGSFIQGQLLGTLESVRIIEVSTFQGCPQGGVPL